MRREELSYSRARNTCKSLGQRLAGHDQGDVMYKGLDSFRRSALRPQLAELREQARVLRDVDVGREARHGDIGYWRISWVGQVGLGRRIRRTPGGFELDYEFRLRCR
jgi:hypothetical protein